MTTLFTGLTALDADGERLNEWILVDGQTITAVGGEDPSTPGSSGPGELANNALTVDLGSRVVTPGLIDLHGHRASGHAYDDDTSDILASLDVHRAHGTTRSVISLVANPIPVLRNSLETIGALVAIDPLIVGAHLEGPFLSPHNRGAHRHDYLATPDPTTVVSLLAAQPGVVRSVTIAPELPYALEAIPTIIAAGAVAAVGHTQADYATARAAFDHGASVLTHTFNAMPGIHHRAPGPILAALDDQRVTLELILDGVHVHPAVARMLFTLVPNRVALITDAMAAAGSVDGAYQLGSFDVTVGDGTALLTEALARGVETIAGSTLLLDQAFRHAIMAWV